MMELAEKLAPKPTRTTTATFFYEHKNITEHTECSTYSVVAQEHVQVNYAFLVRGNARTGGKKEEVTREKI